MTLRNELAWDLVLAFVSAGTRDIELSEIYKMVDRFMEYAGDQHFRTDAKN